MATPISGIQFNPALTSVREAIAKRALELLDRSEPNKRIAVFLDSWVQQNFKGEGDLVGGWTPFKRGGRYIPGVGLDTGAKLLQNTGRLRASFRAFWDDDIVGIGSDLYYAEFHEEGTSTIPQRRMLPTQDDVGDSVLGIYEEYFRKLERKKLW